MQNARADSPPAASRIVIAAKSQVFQQYPPEADLNSLFRLDALENAQAMAVHESPRITKFYADRAGRSLRSMTGAFVLLDVGGTAEQFRKLVEARHRLLAAIGTSAPPPNPPAYAPKGVRMIYRRISISGQGSLGSGGVARLGRAS